MRSWLGENGLNLEESCPDPVRQASWGRGHSSSAQNGRRLPLWELTEKGTYPKNRSGTRISVVALHVAEGVVLPDKKKKF